MSIHGEETSTSEGRVFPHRREKMPLFGESKWVDTHAHTWTRVDVGASEQESTVPGPRSQEEMELRGQARLRPWGQWARGSLAGGGAHVG